MNSDERAWRAHLAFEPDEARLLGLPAEGRKSLRRLGEQVDLYREFASAPEAEVGPALARLSRLAVRRFDRGDEHAALERILLPRLVAMPDEAGYVDELAELLRESLRRGAPPPLEHVEHFAAIELPVIVEQTRDEPSAAAWRRLDALIRDKLLPAARALGRDRWRLGADEYAWRLTNMGLETPLPELVASASASLAEQQAAMAELVGVASFADALPRIHARNRERLHEGEVESTYREANQRCVEFVRAMGLCELPEGFEVPLTMIPAELAATTHAGNLPAPLFGRGGGSFALLDVAARHRRAWVIPLAVHEGVPGHFLQSWLWQQSFRERGAAPSFVSFADSIAAERQDWGAMPAIEGWAVYAEELVRRSGMHEPEHELAVRMFHAIRCARTILDIGLHAEAMPLDAARRLLVEQIAIDVADAERELVRSIRVPTQPTTYFAGAQVIAALVADSGLPLAEAHRRLLAHGPVLPRTLT